MKKALTKNLGLKVLALGFSILLWIIVVNIETPVMEKTYTGIQVTVTHPEIVTNPGNTYQVADESKTVTVTVRAKRSVLEEIEAEDIRATADMRKLDTSTRSLIPVDITIPKYAGDYEEAYSNPPNIQVTIETGTTETFPIIPTASGTLRDGYELGELTANPETIKISGPQSVVDSIERVVAEVDVSGLSRNEELEADMVLYDASGKIIDSTLIDHNLGEEGLKVEVEVLHIKSFPVIFDVSGIQPAAGYDFNGITIQPETVKIVGSKEQLEEIESIDVPAEALAETGLTESVERTVDITEYLPGWAKPADEKTGTPIVVRISITKSGTKSIEFPVNSISMVNVPKGYTVSYKTNGTIEIVVSGSEEALDNFELEQGSVSINLVNIKEEGEYTVPVQVTLADGVSLYREVTVRVAVEKESGGSDG